MIPQASLGNILLVDDDHSIVDFLCLNLKSEGYSVSVIPDSSQLTADALRNIQLVIIDCNITADEGTRVISEIKAVNDSATIGIIYCSEFDDERTIIDALDAGADDCVRKPFSLREMLARIRAIMRRRRFDSSARNADILIFKSLRADTRHKSVRINNEDVSLTNTEFAILEILMRNIGSYTSRHEIFRTVWADSAGSNDRVVDTNISRLRRKLGELGKHITNRSSLGYMLAD